MCCLVSRYIDVCKCDMLSVVNVYPCPFEVLCTLWSKVCLFVVNVMLSLMSVMSPPPCIVQLVGMKAGEVMYIGSFAV